jgi:hypothetical protein
MLAGDIGSLPLVSATDIRSGVVPVKVTEFHDSFTVSRDFAESINGRNLPLCALSSVLTSQGFQKLR